MFGTYRAPKHQKRLAINRLQLQVLRWPTCSANDQVVRNIQALLALGVVGINLEDSIVSENGRTLEDATRFAERLQHIKTRLAENDQDIFINARTDVELPALNTLGKLGVRRVSLGNYPFSQMCSTYATGIARINNEQSLTSLFA